MQRLIAASLFLLACVFGGCGALYTESTCNDTSAWVELDRWLPDGGLDSLANFPLAMAVSGDGRVYVGGMAISGAGQAQGWIIASGDQGKTWSRSGPFDRASGQTAGIQGLLVEPSGSVLAVSQERQTTDYWVFRRSTDGGATFPVIAALQGLTSGDASGFAIGAAPSGKLYSGGTYDDGAALGARVMTASSAGLSWSVSSDFGLGPSSSQANAILPVSDTEIYVGVTHDDVATSTHGWVVLRSQDEGATFTVVDHVVDLQFEADVQALARLPSGAILAAGALGTAASPAAKYGLVVRRSPSGDSGTWQTVLEHRLAGADGTARAYATSLAVHDGRPYVAGVVSADASSTDSRWLVYRGNSEGTEWELVDDYALGGSLVVTPIAMGFGPNGRAYVAGQAASAPNAPSWVVRSRCF